MQVFNDAIRVSATLSSGSALSPSTLPNVVPQWPASGLVSYKPQQIKNPVTRAPVQVPRLTVWACAQPPQPCTVYWGDGRHLSTLVNVHEIRMGVIPQIREIVSVCD